MGFPWIGTNQDPAVTDSTSVAGRTSVIALLKGILAQLQGKATQGVTQTQLTGSLAPAYSGPTTDASGTITTANTAQQVLAAVTARKYLLFYNVSTTDTLWINLGATATTGAGSIPISPLGGFVWESEFIPSDSLSVIGPTAGDAFTCKWA